MNRQDSSTVQLAKQCVIDYCSAFDTSRPEHLASVLKQYTTENFRWRGLHPFHEQPDATQAVEIFWKPLRESFTALQRRVDVFFAAENSINEHDKKDPSSPVEQDNNIVWTCQMGHFMGLMDKAWLDIPPTGRLVFIRFAEFHRINAGKIEETALFIDLISVMRQAGQYPLPPSTGASFLYPGPATGDGLLYSPQAAEQGQTTLKLINKMIEDLSAANERALQYNDDRVPREILARCWDENMLWFGPEGIGATYTIDRYQQQHQYPFRFNLSGKSFNGHVARFAEGYYGAFFGWPNLTNTAGGGFLGLTGSANPADMRVTDIYRRCGDKLVENWVIIDLPHWLNMQGLDVLARMRQLLGIEQF